MVSLWAWLTNAPMPRPLSVFGCVVEAKLLFFRKLTHQSSLIIQQFNTFQLFQLRNSYLESVIHLHLQQITKTNNC